MDGLQGNAGRRVSGAGGDEVLISGASWRGAWRCSEGEGDGDLLYRMVVFYDYCFTNGALDMYFIWSFDHLGIVPPRLPSKLGGANSPARGCMFLSKISPEDSRLGALLGALMGLLGGFGGDRRSGGCFGPCGYATVSGSALTASGLLSYSSLLAVFAHCGPSNTLHWPETFDVVGCGSSSTVALLHCAPNSFLRC